MRTLLRRTTIDCATLVASGLVCSGLWLAPAVSASAFRNQQASSLPALQLPWPTSQQHNQNGGNSYGCGDHTGKDYYAIDFNLAANSEVSAAASGTAHLVSEANSGGYGNLVWIDHGGGVVSLYAHLNSFSVSDGQTVSQGQVVGLSGSTGLSTGAHLHFVIRSGATTWYNGTSFAPEPMSGYTGFGNYGLHGPPTCSNTVSPQYTSSPPAVVGGGPGAPLVVGELDANGTFFAKAGSLSATWIGETGPGVKAIAVASDSSNGPLLGELDAAGNFYAKEGSLSAPWIFEAGPGVKAIAVASDSSNGPLLGELDAAGNFYAKEGSLSAPWVGETGPTVKAIAVASDPSNGPVLGELETDGTFFAKAGSLSATWIGETGPTVKAIAVASDATNGPVLGELETDGTFFAKAGSLSATWIGETGPGVQGIALPGSAGPAPGTPTAPLGVSAAGGDGSAVVSWVAPVSDGANPIAGYSVTSSPGGLTAMATAGATSAVVSGLTNGTSYSFTVTASNAFGPGTTSLPSNSVTPTAPPPTGGGGGGSSVPNLGVSIAVKANTIQPNDADEVTIYVLNTGAGSSHQTHLVIALPTGLTLLGPPYYESGSGCAGTSTIDCFLDYIPNGATSKVILEIRATSTGAQPITATAAAASESDLSNNAATVTIQVGAAFVPPTAVPPATTTKVATASLAGTAIVGRTLIARVAGNVMITGYQWQIRRNGHWRNLVVGATRRKLTIKSAYTGFRLRVRVKLVNHTAVYSTASAVVRRR